MKKQISDTMSIVHTVSMCEGCLRFAKYKRRKLIFVKRMAPNIFRTFITRLVILLIINYSIVEIHGFSPLWDSVKTQVFQEYEVTQNYGQISVVRAKLKNIKKPELIVGENVKANSRLILTCTAWYPSEWVYSGDADPTYISNTTIENLGTNGQVLPLDDVNGAKRYVATMVVGPRGVKQSDTGRYNCMTASPETGMKFKTLSAFFHLFVPGKSLFTRKRGGTILYDLKVSPARIPCGVTNPKIAVSLQKFQNGNLENVDNETMLYHPISGFYPRHDIAGTYVCTAAHNKAFELLHFTLVPKLSHLAASQSIKHASDEDLEWLFNSFKLGQSNRIRLSTKRPSTYVFSGERPKTTSRPQKYTFQTRPSSIWKQPSPEDHEEIDATNAEKEQGDTSPGFQRPVYVLFAEDLKKLRATTKRPEVNSGSGSASGSASEESEEGEDEGETDTGGEAEQEESVEVEEKESQHQYHFDAEQSAPILLQQLLATRRPAPLSTHRPPLHQQFETTYLPFLNFLNPSSAVVKYKPMLNPVAPIRQFEINNRDAPTSKPRPQAYSGSIQYDLHTNKLVFDITRPTSERPVSTRRPSNKFKIPSLPTERWPTTRKVKTTTKPRTTTTTTSTTPKPPLIPDSVVCINSPCGQNAKCFANTVYYHHKKETRREPACKCIDNYLGNPYLECHPPSPEETDFLSFNNSDIFQKRTGPSVESSFEVGHLKNSDVFRTNEPVIVDMRKKK